MPKQSDSVRAIKRVTSIAKLHRTQVPTTVARQVSGRPAMTEPLPKLGPKVVAMLRARALHYYYPDGRPIIDDEVWTRQLGIIRIVDVQEGAPSWTVSYRQRGSDVTEQLTVPAPADDVTQLAQMMIKLAVMPAGVVRIRHNKKTA